MISILYLGETYHGGEVSFIQNLSHQWKRDGVRFQLVFLSENVVTTRPHRFNDELFFENISTAEFESLGPTLVVGLKEKHAPILPKLRSATVLCTNQFCIDVSGHKSFVTDKVRTVNFPNSIFIDRPYIFDVHELYRFDDVLTKLMRVGENLVDPITLKAPFYCYVGMMHEEAFRDLRILLEANTSIPEDKAVRFFGSITPKFNELAGEIDQYWSRYWYGKFPRKLGIASAILSKARRCFCRSTALRYGELEAFDVGLKPYILRHNDCLDSIMYPNDKQLVVSKSQYNTGKQIYNLVVA